MNRPCDGPKSQKPCTPARKRPTKRRFPSHKPRIFPAERCNTKPHQKTSPLQKPPSVSISCIDFLLQICILTITNTVARDTRKMSPASSLTIRWPFGNSPAFDVHRRTTHASVSFESFVVTHGSPSTRTSKYPSAKPKGSKKNTLDLRNVRNVHWRLRCYPDHIGIETAVRTPYIAYT